MSSKRSRKRSKGGQMPATGAGLLRFFEDETPGIRIKPEVVIILAAALIIVSILTGVF